MSTNQQPGFYDLRREAIEHIEQLGSRSWTDYNTHDPGITLLESLLYAITDVRYRANWKIEDLLTGGPPQPFPTAREILTCAPVTSDDHRRSFIDLDLVRNAWVLCKDCTCGEAIVSVKGLYDVWLELEHDDLVGDLNDRLITKRLSLVADGRVHDVIMECRFPQWALVDQAAYDTLVAPGTTITSIACLRLMRTRTGDSLSNTIITDDELRRHWRQVFYTTIEITTNAGNIVVEDIALRFFSDSDGRDVTSINDVTTALVDAAPYGIVDTYQKKCTIVESVLNDAREHYRSIRSLDEDLCQVRPIQVEQVAVCADVDVEVGADMERVQAEIWFAIENYLAPSIPFYSLRELLDAGVPTEEIFNGPILDNGFILQSDLDKADLRAEVRASDIIDLLMDIDGVVSVSDLMMTRYDDEGQVSMSAPWVLPISTGHQPRLYHNLSNVRFRKNDLPFRVVQDEAYAVLTQLRGEAERPKVPFASNDLPEPVGVTRNAASITPVQYALPLTYGVGPEGLPSHAGDVRRAQARQLKAYLLVYEQILGNAFEQVAHVGDLFSLDPSTPATYFAHEFNEQAINGYNDLTSALSSSILRSLSETNTEYTSRRHLFLDHLLARFGFSMEDHALLASEIEDKTALLRIYPEISSGRALPETFTLRIGALLGQVEGTDEARKVVVEHLLLRPKFPGDAVYQECADCEDADPWSFRLTIVMPGWIAPYKDDLDLRDFADRTIKEEVPSHLLPKICWVGNDESQFDDFERAWQEWRAVDLTINWGEERLVDRIVAILQRQNVFPADTDLCAIATELLTSYGDAFLAWMTDNIDNGRELTEFTEFIPPPVSPADVAEFLEDRYASYVEVSYRLTMVIRALERLVNVYPTATLHDCADGSDDNPVRLDRTALGTP